LQKLRLSSIFEQNGGRLIFLKKLRLSLLFRVCGLGCVGWVGWLEELELKKALQFSFGLGLCKNQSLPVIGGSADGVTLTNCMSDCIKHCCI
jgi:hypothetical protein